MTATTKLASDSGTKSKLVPFCTANHSPDLVDFWAMQIQAAKREKQRGRYNLVPTRKRFKKVKP